MTHPQSVVRKTTVQESLEIAEKLHALGKGVSDNNDTIPFLNRKRPGRPSVPPGKDGRKQEEKVLPERNSLFHQGSDF
jgi:hypothetical protein|tara:strand:- start:9084 stop:9317 length:234 start_codon:yes stop_codon:yes gene_type:complete